MKRTLFISIAAVASVIAASCSTNPTYMSGVELPTSVMSERYENEGIYPDTSVLNNPNNPFKDIDISDDLKWQLQGSGEISVRYYCWATVLARTPSGEAQYYTALALRDAASFDTSYKPIAAQAFLTVLDCFFSSVSYLSDGVTYFRLAPLAYQELVDIGDEYIPSDYALITDDNGNTIVVRP